MRRLPLRFLLSSGLTAALLVLPTVTLPAAAARPVAPGVTTLRLTGVDAAAIAGSPAPHDDEVERGGARWRPVAALRRSTTDSFAALGVTWAASPAPDVAVQVRTRSDGRWSAWTEVEVQGNATGDTGSVEGRAARAGSDPLYVGPSTGVQVRVDAGATRPRDLRLELIEPGTSAADASATAAARTLGGAEAGAAEPKPAYVTRAQWGADESLRGCTPTSASTIKGGILHTTATRNDYTATESPAIMRSMYAYHTKSLGWCDLGYNFVVDKYGILFEGRYGGVEKAVIGAHTGGFNTYTFGVSMIGHHDLVAPSDAMRTTVEKVFAWKLGLYGRDAAGTTTYTSGGGSSTKYPAGTVVTMPVISGHRDYSAKSCPGNEAYPLLPTIRSNVAARMGSTAATALTSTSVTLRTAPSRITYGASTTISGMLAAADGAEMGSKPLELYVRRPGTTTWARLSSPTTAADGTFSGTHRPANNLEYRIVYRGDAVYAGSRRDGRVNVAAGVKAALSSSSVKRGNSVALRGTVTPAHPDQKVLRQRLVDGAWKTVAKRSLSSTSTYSFRIRPRKAGTLYFRVVKPGDGDHVRASSPARTLTVY